MWALLILILTHLLVGYTFYQLGKTDGWAERQQEVTDTFNYWRNYPHWNG